MSFGLLSTEVTRPYESINSRRKIFWNFPQGAAQLTGILSLLPNADEADKSLFGWWERRFPTQRTQTITTGSSGSDPFSNADNTVLTDSGSGVTLTADTVYRIDVVDTSQFKPTHVIGIRFVNQWTPNVIQEITGVVTQIYAPGSGRQQLAFRPNATWTGVVNQTTPSGAGITNDSIWLYIKGTANQENARSGQGIFVVPINPTNRTQIYRSAFQLSRTALKGGLLFDKSGPYSMMAKENGMRHMLEMEKSFLFGDNHEVAVSDPYTGDITPETQTGGVLWFLQQWEAQYSIYRGGNGTSTGPSAVTGNSNDDKRIINCGGTLTQMDYETYLQRLFRVTQDKGYEKLCLCGAKFLAVINKLFDRQRIVKTEFTEEKTKAKFLVWSHETLFGTVHYKTHPLFTEDPALSGNGLFVDLGNLRYRPLTDSDTKFFKGRQENDRDGRKDEWVTEAGLELKYPESNLYMTQVWQAA